jgi:hypothetical protein
LTKKSNIIASRCLEETTALQARQKYLHDFLPRNQTLIPNESNLIPTLINEIISLLPQQATTSL